MTVFHQDLMRPKSLCHTPSSGPGSLWHMTVFHHDLMDPNFLGQYFPFKQVFGMSPLSRRKHLCRYTCKSKCTGIYIYICRYIWICRYNDIDAFSGRGGSYQIPVYTYIFYKYLSICIYIFNLKHLSQE